MREGWSSREQSDPPGMRYFRWHEAGADPDDAAKFWAGALTPVERDVLARLAAGERVVGVEMQQDTAAAFVRSVRDGWRDWIGDYGEEDDGA